MEAILNRKERKKRKKFEPTSIALPLLRRIHLFH
jgi:hypothetical protein